MSTGDLFNDVIAEFEAAFGAVFNATHYAKTLGLQDSITGQYISYYPLLARQ
jgi:hypothetical protein